MQHLFSPHEIFKSVYSICLLIFSVIIIMGLIYIQETKFSSEISSFFAYVALWGAIVWLTMVEGGQGSLVGLAPVNGGLYKDSHPIAHRITSVAHKGDNLDRYLLGRQFMVVIIVFIINMAGGPLEGAEIWGFPKVITDAFLGSGLAMILLTAMVGQLNSQVNASLCMLDYINNYFALVTFWIAMAIEYSGLLHASYVVQMVVSAISGEKIESHEEPRNFQQNVFFWSRCLFSITILIFCFAVTLEALFAGKTTMWDGVPPILAVIIFFFLMSVVGMLEGMQIAFFAVAKLPSSQRGDAHFATKTCDLLFKGNGNNLPGFMIGRQLCVVSCMFFVARVTSVSIPEGESNIFGVGDNLQRLFDTGLLGALIVTIVGSIAWQLIASAYPIMFLSNPATYVLLRICLFLESTGICSGAWVLALVHKKIAGFQRDEVYIGTAEERAKHNMEDEPENLHVGPGHPIKLPGFAENMPSALFNLLISDSSVMQYVTNMLQNSSSTNESTTSKSWGYSFRNEVDVEVPVLNIEVNIADSSM